MPETGRSPSKLHVYALALPIIAFVYVTTFGGRLWAALRPAVATFLGATVIASVYGEVAYRRTPTPVRAAAVVFLSVTLMAQSFAAPPSAAAADPAQSVIAAARQYLGSNYRLGSEGPRTFDCSGLMYRIFADAGELPRIGGMRLRARGYMQYFVSRGRFSRDASAARPGDLVVYAKGAHIGIYVGNGRVISALVQPWGVTEHRMKSINYPVTYILHVNWGGGDGGNNGGGNNGGGSNGGGSNGSDNTTGGGGGNGGGIEVEDLGSPGEEGNNTSSAPDSKAGGNIDTGGERPTDEGGNGDQSARPNGKEASALGTMNLRTKADPNARIIGWVGRSSSFKVIGEGTSPAGYQWFEIQTRSGKTGWVYARWVKLS